MALFRLLNSFLLGFAIASIAVTGGIGGGVLLTPLMLAFTPVDTLMVYSSYVQLDNKALRSTTRISLTQYYNVVFEQS
ncbi:MAG: hypothetical protein DRI01_05925 [Chloroflexi bacterium]|nr:MAG: hypothetical protein DRI01_05925 [Chloroflexota bacterium]